MPRLSSTPKAAELGKPVWRTEDIPTIDTDAPASTMAAKIAKAVTDRPGRRSELKEAYGLTAAQVERDEKRTEQAVKAKVERAYTEHVIAQEAPR